MINLEFKETSLMYGDKEVSVAYLGNVNVFSNEKVKDLSMYDIYGNPIQQTTANCYVVNAAGTYKIPLVFGNALKNGSTNSTAYTNNGGTYSHNFVDFNGTVVTSPYIENISGKANSAQLSIADTDGIFTDIRIVDGSPCRYLQFKVNSVPDTGANGVLSIKNSRGVIMWSWHIWVWPYDLTPVEIVNSTGVGYNILPVNLATKLDTADSINKTTGWKNWSYQWGRPTPLLCPSAYNSGNNHARYGVLNFSIANTASAIQDSIKNPTKFYKYRDVSYGYYHWFGPDGTQPTTNLWDAACSEPGASDNNVMKTIYDPCPIGFKMPNGNTFTYFSKSNVVDSFANGWKFKRYSDDTVGVFFPASGYRGGYDGLLFDTSFTGIVHTSALEHYTGNLVLSFDDTYISTKLTQYADSNSVRPVQDTGIEGLNKRTKIRIDQTITDPEAMITRIVDLGGIEAIRANSHRYTGKFANNVMTLKQLDDNNSTVYADGTMADLTTIGTDVWMKLPQFHWKCSQYATDVWDFEVVYGAKPDDTYKTWDGNDLIGAYEAYNSSSNLYSVSYKISTYNVSQADFKTYARARGEGFSLVKWKHHCIMAMLYYTMYNNTDCQNNIGKGTNSSGKKTGTTNSLGMSDTISGGTGDSNSINFWGLENWWGNRYEWMDNIVVDARVWKVTEDDGTVRQAGTGCYSSGYITKLLFGENIDLIPTAVNGSSKTGFCDYYIQPSDISYVARRSSSNSSTDGGVAYVDLNLHSQNTNTHSGSRLAFRGNIVIES